MQEQKGHTPRGSEPSGKGSKFTIKTIGKGDVEDVLERATGKWWRALADEWRAVSSAACLASESDEKAKKGPRFAPPSAGRGAAPEEDAKPLELNVTVGGSAIDVPMNVTQETVAAAIASAYLDRLRDRTEVLENVDARLEALQKKLLWLEDARNSSLLSADDYAAEKDALLGAFRALEA